MGRYGVQATRGDPFGDAVTVAGTFGWLAVFVAVLFAHIAERPRLAAVIPLAWFVGLVLTTLIVAATIARCPVRAEAGYGGTSTTSATTPPGGPGSTCSCASSP